MLGSSLHATWTKPYQLVQSELPHPILSTATKSCFNHQNLHCSTFLLADNSGNTDYSDLHRWSPHLHSGYKSPAPNDNSSYIYTSDYGSYSSQESNHSGTTCTYSSNNKIIHNIYKYIQFTRYLAVCINFELIKQPWTVDITLIYQQPMYGISDTCGISLWCFSFVVCLCYSGICGTCSCENSDDRFIRIGTIFGIRVLKLLDRWCNISCVTPGYPLIPYESHQQ